MMLPTEGKLLRIFIGEADRWHGRPLHEAIIEEARKRGVRALHGEAVSTRLRKDRVYSITLRSTGELTILPVR